MALQMERSRLPEWLAWPLILMVLSATLLPVMGMHP